MDIIQIVIQGGSVGVAAYTLYILFKLMGNHLNHNTEVLSRLEVTVTKLQEFLETKLEK